MDHESLETKLVQRQDQYIQELEGKLDIYKVISGKEDLIAFHDHLSSMPQVLRISIQC